VVHGARPTRHPGEHPEPRHPEPQRVV